MQPMICTLPLVRLPLASLAVPASNADHFLEHNRPESKSACFKPSVRWIYRSQDMNSNGFALSGKLADVCAVLDELIDLEVRNARQCCAY